MDEKHNKIKEIRENVCPVAALLKVISSRWTNEILWHLGQEDDLRFGALKKKVSGISTKVLTERLRMLEKHAIVYREQKLTIPPAVHYSLTEKGRDIFNAIRGLQNVAVKWGFTSTQSLKDI